jgi:hypothetical protein
MKATEILTVGGLCAAALGGRNRVAAALAGAALVASSAFTRFGVFHAGRTSARDPKVHSCPAAGPHPTAGPGRILPGRGLTGLR